MKEQQDRVKGYGVSDVWQTKDLEMAILEVWQAKDLAADSTDLWQTQGLAAFLKEAGVRVGGMRKTAWRGNIILEASRQNSHPIPESIILQS